ncbi:MAG: hypothetical protein OHK0053_12430 [Microscillaceae bacterium]
MVLGWFKKKKNDDTGRAFDPTQATVRDLVQGAFLDYDLKTWEVREVFEYDWGDNFFSDEFLLTTADEKIYLSVEDGDDLFISISTKIIIHDIEEDVVGYTIRNETPPMKLTYQGETYYRKSESIGYWRNVNNDKWTELVSWLYYDRDQKNILTIEQWGEEEFEASQGKIVQEFEFSNIIMP